MALAYLLDPCLQYQNRAGVNNVAGYLEVFRMDTDDRATVYVDFNGTLAPEHIGIDNDGRAVMIVESGRPYRVEMHGPNGDLFWTQQPVWTVASGGGVSGTDIVSSDGSIAVDKTTVGSFTTYDLSAHVEDSTDLLGWIRCDGASNIDGTDIWKPTYTAGTLMVGERGVMLTGGQYFHATAHVRVTKTGVAPYYDDMNLVFATYDGETRAEVSGKGIVVDGSMGLSQDFEVSCDVLPESNCELLLEIAGKELASIGVQVLDMEVHRVFSGAPYIPGGVAGKPWVDENYQEKLVPGPGITIDPETNVITATAGDTEIFQVTYGTTTFSEIREALIAGKLPVLFIGDPEETGVTVKRIPIYDYFYGSSKYVQFWSPYVYTSASTANEPYASFTVYSASYDSGTGDTNWNTSYKYFAEQPDWAENDARKLTFIKNRPDLSAYATDEELAQGLATKQGVIDDLDQIRSGASAGATALQPSDVAQVAISGDYADLTNKPTIPTNTSDLTNDSGFITASEAPVHDVQVNSSSVVDANGVANIDLSGKQDVLTAGSNITISNNVISATASPQVQADWAQTDSSAVDFIKSKPQNLVQDANYVHTDNNFTTADVTKLSGIAAGAQVNVQADWSESDSSSDGFILNKPTIPVVPPMKNLIAGSGISLNDTGLGLEISSTATGSTQADWSETDPTDPSYILNKPTIPAAQVNSDWNAAAGVSAILNKPAIPVVPTMKELVAGSNVSLIETTTTVTVSATNIPVVGTITL